MSFLIESLPATIQAYILANFVDTKQLTSLRLLSSRWRDLIDTTITIWKQQFCNNFPAQVPNYDETTEWRKIFVQTWKAKKYNSFDTSIQNSINHAKEVVSDNDRTVIHGKGIYYLTLRTKFGYKKGLHYWEVTSQTEGFCSIGVCLSITPFTRLGDSLTGWGLYKGELFHAGKVVANAINGQNNVPSTVGVLLDMDRYTLKYYIKGEQVLFYSNPDWAGQTVYPSVSLTVTNETVSINFDVTMPEQTQSLNNLDYFEQLPETILMSIFGKFLDIEDLFQFRLVSSYWKEFIDGTQSIWRTQHSSLCPGVSQTSQVNWTAAVKAAWKDLHSWDPTNLSTIHTFTNRNKTVIHNKGIRYLPVKTKIGFKTGVHYWEIVTKNCHSFCVNTSIGICNKLWTGSYTGIDSINWGLRGDGRFYHNDKIVATATRSFDNEDVVGVLLKMEQIEFLVNGELVLTYDLNEWTGQTFYPSATILMAGEEISIRFGSECKYKPF